jgi:lipoic acid synthetase
MSRNPTAAPQRKPQWLKARLPDSISFGQVRALLHENELHTVCEEAQCPNRWECFSRSTATFLIMGSRCTRDCRFCAVEHGPKEWPDPQEPSRVARVAAGLSLNHVVLTSVTRDDLTDGGASCFAAAIAALRSALPGAGLEVLVPDFQGSQAALEAVLAAGPDVLNHNLETVSRLYAEVRPQAGYERSLELLRRSKRLAPGIAAKSGLMLGLGETEPETERALQDLLACGVDIVTLGQYLQPTRKHLPVHRYLTPREFDRWRFRAESMGFAAAVSGPFVRSSYQAKEAFDLWLHRQSTP